MLINSNGSTVRVVGKGTLANDIVLMLREVGQSAESIGFEEAVKDPNFAQYQYLVGISRSFSLRTDIIDWINDNNLHSPILVHEKAYVADVNDLGAGTIVYPMASVLKSKVGKHVMLGVNTHVGHNSTVSDCCLFLPCSTILGSAYLGFNTILQSTAVVGDAVTIDAMYVNILPRAFVTKDIFVTGTYGGTPARRVNDHGVNTAEYFNA